MRLISYMHDATDNDIIDDILKGQQKPFAILVERYQHYVYTLTLRYIKDNQEAEEIAQDIFVKVYHALHTFNKNSKFSTWLYTIARNTCLSHLRKTNPKFEEIQDDNIGYNASFPIEQKSEKEQLSLAINKLTKQEGEIITLYYLHEQTIEEIEHITGLSKSNIKVRLYRARKNLKTILEQYANSVLIDNNK